jgi:hypothetical protein
VLPLMAREIGAAGGVTGQVVDGSSVTEVAA